MKEIKTEILINSSSEKVWGILTNFTNYPAWNPFIKSLKGYVREGSKITVRLEPRDAGGMTFKPTVLIFNKNQELRWIGHLLFSGLFDGEHSFELVDHGNGTTTFKQCEKFNGILVPFLRKILDINTVHGFHLMNQKLKELSEQT